MVPPEKKQRVVIAGGGPAGALLALYLARRRFEVDLFEAMDEDKIAGPGPRSWNVVIMGRGLEALDNAGVDLHEEAGELATTINGAVKHHKKKKLGPSMTNKNISICRGDLSKTLLNKAYEMENVNIEYGCKFVDVDMDERVASFERENGEILKREYDMLVGADGVNSRVRHVLEETVLDFTVLRDLKDPVAYKTILIPVMGMQDAEERWKTCFHVSNSKDGCLIATPTPGGMLSAVVLLPSEGKNSFGSLMKTTQDVRNFFSKNYPTIFYPDGPSEDAVKDFLELRPQHLRSLYCSKLTHGSTILIGDAAHAMWASLGQGLNAALEDCAVLGRILDDEEGEKGCVDVQSVLGTYNELRLEDVHAVCALSEEGMGGARSIRPAFAAQLLLTTLLNKTLGKLAPKIFTPASLFVVNNPKITYGEVMRGVNREAVVTKAVFFVGLALAFVGVARNAIAKF